MELHLKDKRALVTGAGSGLGKAAAMTLAGEGCQLVIASRTAENLAKTAEDIHARTQAKISPCPADISKAADIDKLLTHARSHMGDPDIAVISTGHPPTDHFANATDAQWQEGIALILDPVIRICRGVIPAMQKKKYGRIIIVGSIFGVEHEESSIIQSTLRRGILGFAKCAARDYAADNISVNVIAPGYFDTPLLNRHARLYAERQKKSVEAVLDEWKNFAPAKRFGTAEEFGALVALLASPLGGFINGTNIVADGASTRSL